MSKIIIPYVNKGGIAEPKDIIKCTNEERREFLLSQNKEILIYYINHLCEEINNLSKG